MLYIEHEFTNLQQHVSILHRARFARKFKEALIVIFIQNWAFEKYLILVKNI